MAIGSSWTVLEDPWGSDHLPCITLINAPVAVDGARSEMKRWMYHRASWDLFREDCENVIDDGIVDADRPLESYDRFTERVLAVAHRHIPAKKQTDKGRVKTVPYWSSECADAIKARNKAKRHMCKTRSLRDAEEYRRLKGIAQYVVKSAQKDSWRAYCAALNDQSQIRQVWAAARRMRGENKTSIIPTLCKGDKTCCTDKQKADLLALTYSQISSTENYSSQFRIYKEKFEKDNYEFINETAHIHNLLDPINGEFTIAELGGALNRCREMSSPGLDGISYCILKKLPFSSLLTLLKIFNAIWKGGKLPPSWKKSLVTPIQKDGKPKHDPNSYRPISLTPSLCKLMERMVTARLTLFLEERGVLAGHQAGFREGRGVMDNILKLQDKINRSLAVQEYTLAVFIDLKNAFDLMWRQGLLHKLRKMGVTGRTYHFIRDFLTDRVMQVRVGGCLSDEVELANGTPQGSVISPLLFIIMMNDMPIDRLHGCQLSLFADDATTYTSGSDLQIMTKNTQKYLNRIESWCDTTGFKISVDKTVAMIFSRNLNKTPFPLIIQGKEIAYKKQFKFLGVVFDSQLTWSPHIQYIVDKCARPLNLMRSISAQSWGGGKRVLLMVYRALILSLLDYGCLAMGNAADTVLAKLATIQSKALTLCNCAMRGTPTSAQEVECGIMPLHLRRELMSLTYACKISHQPQNPAKNILIPTQFNRKSRINRNRKTIFTDMVTPTLSSMGIRLIQPLDRQGPVDGRLFALCHIDRSLTKNVDCWKYSRSQRGFDSQEFVSQFVDMIHVYVDGARAVNGRAAAAVSIPSLNLQWSSRLTDGCSSFTAELFALKMAVDKLLHLRSENNRFVVFTDSLDVLDVLEDSRRESSSSDVYWDVRETIDALVQAEVDLVITWVPGHAGIPGSTLVDALAKQALSLSEINNKIQLRYIDQKEIIKRYILSRWQTEWDCGNTGRHYHKIQPTVSTKCKFVYDRGRSKETCLTRMRLGRNRLNFYLNRIKCHPTGLCDYCGEPETIQHFLLECAQNEELVSFLKRFCAALGLPCTLHTVLNHYTTQSKIYHYAARYKKFQKGAL